MTASRLALAVGVLVAFTGTLACSDDTANNPSPHNTPDSDVVPSTDAQTGVPDAQVPRDAADPSPSSDASGAIDASRPLDTGLGEQSDTSVGDGATGPAETADAADAAAPDSSPADAAPDASSSVPDLPDATPIEDVPFMAPRGPCSIEDRVGRFSAERQVDFGVVTGNVFEGVVPSNIPELVRDEYGCQLNRKRTLICLPACAAGETCGEGGECIPQPKRISVGDVQIAGLTKATLMQPQMPGSIYFAPGADNPPYLDQSEVILAATGAGTEPPFYMFGKGSEPLVDEPTWFIEAGEDFIVEWPAPTSDTGSSVLIELTIDQHGSSPLSLSCEFEDTGSATVPGSLIQEFVGAGVSGFPNGRITRRTVDHVDLGVGCVEFAVGSPIDANVSVVGYTPCHGDEDCPQDQTCNIPLERCE